MAKRTPETNPQSEEKPEESPEPEKTILDAGVSKETLSEASQKEQREAKESDELALMERLKEGGKLTESMEPIGETEEEKAKKLAEAMRELGGKQELKLPNKKSLWETLGKIREENKDNWKEEWKNIFKKLNGERSYRYIKKEDGSQELQYLKLKIIPGQKINESSELTFIVYDKNGQETGEEVTQEIGRIKHREWKRIKNDDELPKDGDVFVTDKRRGAKMEKGEKENEYVLKNTENKNVGRVNLPAEKMRRYENVNEEGELEVAYKKAIKPRSEVAKEFKESKPESLEEISAKFAREKSREMLDKSREGGFIKKELKKVKIGWQKIKREIPEWFWGEELSNEETRKDTKHYLDKFLPDELPKYEKLLEKVGRYERVLESEKEKITKTSDKKELKQLAKSVKNYEKQIYDTKWEMKDYENKARWRKEDYVGTPEYYNDKIEEITDLIKEAKGSGDQDQADRLQIQIDELEKKANPPRWKKIVNPVIKQVSDIIKWPARRYPATTAIGLAGFVGFISGGPVGAVLGALPALAYGAREIYRRDYVGPIWFNKLIGQSPDRESK